MAGELSSKALLPGGLCVAWDWDRTKVERMCFFVCLFFCLSSVTRLLSWQELWSPG